MRKPHYSRDLPAARLAQLAPGADGHPREDGDQQRAPGGGARPRPPGKRRSRALNQPS